MKINEKFWKNEFVCKMHKNMRIELCKVWKKIKTIDNK